MPIVTEATQYGYRAQFLDPVSVADIEAWTAAVQRAVAGRDGFGQLVDLRHRSRTGRDAAVQEATRDAMLAIRGWGLVRSASVVANHLTVQRLRRWGELKGLQSCERFIDGCHPDWEKAALAWIVEAVDPWVTLDARSAHPRRVVDWPCC